MKRRFTETFLLSLLWSTMAFAQTNCNSYNSTAGPFEWSVSGTQGHATGKHSFSIPLGGSCSYTGTTPGAACAATCLSTYGPGSLETEVGKITPTAYSHELGETFNTGQGSAPSGGPTQCAVTAAFAVNSCILSCAVTINISASPNGAGATVSFPSSAIFTAQDTYTTTCIAETLPMQGGGGGCAVAQCSNPGDPEYCPPPDEGGSSDCCDLCPTCTNCPGDGDVLRLKSRGKFFNLSALDKKN
jgi:hypothetical protein